MKNVTTPRTLADCQFVTGYTRASMQRRRWHDGVSVVVVLAGVVCALAVIGWRMQ